MTQLTLPEKPARWTDELVAQLTEQFEEEGIAVWSKKWIKEAVAKIAFGKCVYSESFLGEEGKYMEVEHFYPKSEYPEKVMEWGNLLPANKKCNTTKGATDPNTIPLINPLVDNPKEHLYLKAYRLYAKTAKGKNTIIHTALNDRKHFVEKRFLIGDKILETLSELLADIQDTPDLLMNPSNQRTRKINKLKRLMEEGDRKSAYAATVATVVLESEEYNQLKHLLMDANLWEEALIELEEELGFCALFKAA